MNRSTTLFLFLLVLGLGGLVWWQTAREERGDFDFVERLFDGVDTTRVVSMRVDNVERGVQLTLQRDDKRAWAITDPIAYPARASVIDGLLDVVRKGVISLVPADELDLADEGFDPPRAVFEVSESLAAADPRRTRVEVGAVDLDGNRVYVRVRGKVYRTLRNLDTLLELNVNEYREQRTFDMAPEDVVRVSRTSRAPLPEDEQDAAALTRSLGLLQAHRQQFRWWIDHPVRGQADPSVFQILVTHMAMLRVDRFVDDAPTELARYGLQSPLCEIELESRHGLTQVLAIGIVDGAAFAKRADLPYVWGLETSNLARLYIQAEDLLDHNLVRVLRNQVGRIEIENGRELVVLERVFDPSQRALGARDEDKWTVRTQPFEGDGQAATTPLPANREKVERILSQLEHSEVIRYVEDASLEESFEGRERLGIWLQIREERQGGRVGKRYLTEGGAPARTFLRDDESEICLVPDEVAEMCRAASILDLLSLELFDTDEVHLRRLFLRHGDKERRFFRSIEGTWRYEDLDTIATELFGVLDALFFLRATEHLELPADGAPAQALSQPVEVEIVDAEGNRTQLTIAASAAHGVVAENGGRRSVLEDQDLHARLLALFE